MRGASAGKRMRSSMNNDHTQKDEGVILYVFSFSGLDIVSKALKESKSAIARKKSKDGSKSGRETIRRQRISLLEEQRKRAALANGEDLGKIGEAEKEVLVKELHCIHLRQAMQSETALGLVDLYDSNSSSSTDGSDTEAGDAPAEEHPQESIAQKPQGRKLCKYFARGFCRRGSKCTFDHPPKATVSESKSTPVDPRRKNLRREVSRVMPVTLDTCFRYFYLLFQTRDRQM
ncbi:hypothetical protein HDU96_000268 [Phlyctochytrium bullatum]|nr:hypothetical protein HDU96_000268 [Phlyctochytrium bullatum]